MSIETLDSFESFDKEFTMLNSISTFFKESEVIRLNIVTKKTQKFKFFIIPLINNL